MIPSSGHEQVRPARVPAHARCRVTFSVYFLVLVTCMLALDTTGLTALALFCVVVHEAGHLLALRSFHQRVRALDFHLFGVDMVLARTSSLSYGREAFFHLSGPLANLFFCGVMRLLQAWDIWARPAEAVFLMSLFLALFNLLPVGSLDGGRALTSLLCLRVSQLTAERVLLVCSCLILLPLCAAGFWLLLCAKNITLLAAAVYLLASLIWHGIGPGGGPIRHAGARRSHSIF